MSAIELAKNACCSALSALPSLSTSREYLRSAGLTEGRLSAKNRIVRYDAAAGSCGCLSGYTSHPQRVSSYFFICVQQIAVAQRFRQIVNKVFSTVHINKMCGPFNTIIGVIFLIRIDCMQAALGIIPKLLDLEKNQRDPIIRLKGACKDINRSETDFVKFSAIIKLRSPSAVTG